MMESHSENHLPRRHDDTKGNDWVLEGCNFVAHWTVDYLREIGRAPLRFYVFTFFPGRFIIVLRPSLNIKPIVNWLQDLQYLLQELPIDRLCSLLGPALHVLWIR